LPKKMNCMSATTKATPKNKNQIQFNAIGSRKFG
jgi:hypothetical protein